MLQADKSKVSFDFMQAGWPRVGAASLQYDLCLNIYA